MTKKIRALILSCTTILLCVTVAVAGTFALFTDSASIRNHLKAGTLDIELNRILLTGETLAADGTVSTVNNTEEVAFTEGTSRTVFDTENSVVVPGSFFEATMEIVNNGNVAFGYWIEVVPASGTTADDLLSQLTFTVTPLSGTPVSETIDADGKLSLGSETSHVATVSATTENTTFKVKVSFENSTTKGENDKAKGQELDFDLIVYAVQATA